MAETTFSATFSSTSGKRVSTLLIHRHDIVSVVHWVHPPVVLHLLEVEQGAHLHPLGKADPDRRSV